MWLPAPCPICVCLCAPPFKRFHWWPEPPEMLFRETRGCFEGSVVLLTGCAPATWAVRTGLVFKPGHPPCGAISASSSALGHLSVDCPLCGFPCSQPQVRSPLSSLHIGHLPSLPVGGAQEMETRCSMLFMLWVGKMEFGRQMVYQVTSLRAPEGSSGDSLLLWALGSIPPAGQVPRDLQPGWGQCYTAGSCCQGAANCIVLDGNGHMLTCSVRG